MNRILSALKDIQGVVGSFVIDVNGSLLSREMPALYPDSVFPEIGRRLGGVSGALETQKGPYTELLLKFDAYWLLSRRTPHCSLNILTTDAVNYPALRMATNVAVKQIEEQIAAATAPIKPLATSPVVFEEEEEALPAPEPAPEPVAAAPAKARRMWRGQYVD